MFNIPRYSRDDRVDALAYAFIKFMPSKVFPKHPTRKYRVIYKGHPIVTRLCWFIRRWIRINPWLEGWLPDDADPVYIRDNNTLIMGERTYRIMQAQIPKAQGKL